MEGFTLHLFYLTHTMKKLSLQQITAVAMLIFGCTLTTIGFFLDPAGDISNSVLWVLGQSLIYAGSVFGLKNYVDAKLGDHARN